MAVVSGSRYSGQSPVRGSSQGRRAWSARPILGSAWLLICRYHLRQAPRVLGAEQFHESSLPTRCSRGSSMAFCPEQGGGRDYEQVRGLVRPGARRSSERICTVAVPGGWVSSGDGDLGLRAHFATMFVAVDGAGNLVFADAYADTIRVVAAATGRFYGVRMTGGDIYLAADTAGGFALGGLPARVPLSDLPVGVAADPSCGLIIGFTTSGPPGPRGSAGARAQWRPTPTATSWPPIRARASC